MILYLLDSITFDLIRRRRLSFSAEAVGHWEKEVRIVRTWRMTPDDGIALVGRLDPYAYVPGIGLFSPEAFKLAVEAGNVSGSLEEIPPHGPTEEI